MSPCKGPSHRVYASPKSPDLGGHQPSSWCYRGGLRDPTGGLSGTVPPNTPSRGPAGFPVSGFGGALPGTLSGSPQSLSQYKLKPVKLELPTRGFEIPNDHEAAKEWPETGYEIRLPASTLSWSDVTSHHQQVFVGEGKT